MRLPSLAKQAKKIYINSIQRQRYGQSVPGRTGEWSFAVQTKEEVTGWKVTG